MNSISPPPGSPYSSLLKPTPCSKDDAEKVPNDSTLENNDYERQDSNVLCESYSKKHPFLYKETERSNKTLSINPPAVKLILSEKNIDSPEYKLVEEYVVPQGSDSQREIIQKMNRITKSDIELEPGCLPNVIDSLNMEKLERMTITVPYSYSFPCSDAVSTSPKFNDDLIYLNQKLSLMPVLKQLSFDVKDLENINPFDNDDTATYRHALADTELMFTNARSIPTLTKLKIVPIPLVIHKSDFGATGIEALIEHNAVLNAIKNLFTHDKLNHIEFVLDSSSKIEPKLNRTLVTIIEGLKENNVLKKVQLKADISGEMLVQLLDALNNNDQLESVVLTLTAKRNPRVDDIFAVLSNYSCKRKFDLTIHVPLPHYNFTNEHACFNEAVATLNNTLVEKNGNTLVNVKVYEKNALSYYNSPL